MALVGSCTKPAPTVTALGSVVSADGKRALTLFTVVPGGILDDYLALNLSKPGASYSEHQTMASFSRASALRVFWAATGQPAVTGLHLEGAIFKYGKSSLLVVCGYPNPCPSLPTNARQVYIDEFPYG